jgi:hypothetical protein
VLNAPFIPKHQYFPKLTHDLPARIEAFHLLVLLTITPRCCNMFPAKFPHSTGAGDHGLVCLKCPAFSPRLYVALHVVEGHNGSMPQILFKALTVGDHFANWVIHPHEWRNTDAADAEPSYAGSKSSICQTQYREAAAQKTYEPSSYASL